MSCRQVINMVIRVTDTKSIGVLVMLLMLVLMAAKFHSMIRWWCFQGITTSGLAGILILRGALPCRLTFVILQKLIVNERPEWLIDPTI